MKHISTFITVGVGASPSVILSKETNRLFVEALNLEQ
jgi:hypothetical protein